MGPRATSSAVEIGMSASRSALLRTLRAQAEPTSLAALSKSTGLHANTLREHLAALMDAGLVERRHARPEGRGRPAGLYSATEAPPGNPYPQLVTALVSALHRTSTDPVADAAHAGAAWGRTLASSRATQASSAAASRRDVTAILDEIGFAPQPNERGTRVRLTRCPLLEAATTHPEIVCSVHEGIVRGVLEQRGESTLEPELVPFAEPGACVLHLRTVAN